MKTLKRLFAVALILGVLSLAVYEIAGLGIYPAPQGTYVVKTDYGGYVHLYERKYRRLARSHKEIAIDGECSSACTMLFGYFPLERICVTPRAKLGFHMPTEKTDDGKWIPTQDGARDLMAMYPPQIQRWLARKGGLKPDMIYLRGEELRKVIRRCT
ncbi:MAG: hypothetical protein KF794_07605 [Xanthobacteraceae bacterium]|nr:hypothetical protein [Xanthobacteraceae bacterium]QYK43685.1 MAG: hypothetical protein KF794_07605 [Xanthobacteraceae bacterium]